MKKIVIILIVIAFVTLVVIGQSTIRITSPRFGYTLNKMFNLSFTSLSREVIINYNGIPLIAKGQSFSREMVAARGFNKIVVSDRNDSSIISSVNFYAVVLPVPIKVFLSWDTDGTDMDLHVVEPSGEECYYGYPTTKSGGSLDADVTTGYGPEIYTQTNIVKGLYKIFIHFYGGNDQTNAKVYVIAYEGASNEKRYSYEMKLPNTDSTIEVGNFEVE